MGLFDSVLLPVIVGQQSLSDLEKGPPCNLSIIDWAQCYREPRNQITIQFKSPESRTTTVLLRI